VDANAIDLYRSALDELLADHFRREFVLVRQRVQMNHLSPVNLHDGDHG
jgi:hypothetical protein